MKRLLFIFVLINCTALAFGQRENVLPLKGTSAATDTIRVVKDNQSSLMLRSVLQGAIYDSLANHTDTLQALRADIDAGGSVDVMDSIAAHRTELNDLHDSIADHRIDIDANLDSIATHRTELNNAVDSLAVHRSDIDANSSQITTNSSNISANSVFISVNTSDVGKLQDSIAKHTDTLQVHQDQIADLNDSLFWSHSGTTIFPKTSGNDIQLESATGNLQFGGSDDYINGASGSHTINFYTDGTQKMLIGPVSIASLVSIYPSGSVNLGSTGSFWSSIYGNVHYVGAATNYLAKDGSDNMTFTDAVTGTKTLAELAASSSANDSSWTSISVDTINSNSVSTEFYSDGTLMMRLINADGAYVRTRSVIPFSNNTYSSGSTGLNWTDVRANRVVISEASDTESYIEEDGSDNMTFTDIVTGTKTLAELAEPAIISASLTDGTPTDAEIDSATGTTPATAGAGYRFVILDSDGSGLIYIVISDGTNWQYTALTKAT